MIKTMQTDLNGHALVALEHGGQPALLAAQVSLALGYRQSRRLASLIRNEWSAEFIEGAHYVIVKGQELRALKALRTQDDSEIVSSRARHTLLLLESGINLVTLKTGKPAGIALRKLFAEVVMPEMARTGQYIPGSSAATTPTTAMATATEPEQQPETDWRILRERRLALAADRKHNIERARFMVDQIQAICQTGQLTPELKANYLAMSVEIVMGRSMPALHPRLSSNLGTPADNDRDDPDATLKAPGSPSGETSVRWRRPHALAALWFGGGQVLRGSNWIGRAAGELGLKVEDNPDSERFLGSRTNQTGEADCWRYNKRAAIAIHRWIKAIPTTRRPLFLSESAKQGVLF